VAGCCVLNDDRLVLSGNFIPTYKRIWLYWEPFVFLRVLCGWHLLPTANCHLLIAICQIAICHPAAPNDFDTARADQPRRETGIPCFGLF